MGRTSTFSPMQRTQQAQKSFAAALAGWTCISARCRSTSAYGGSRNGYSHKWGQKQQQAVCCHRHMTVHLPTAPFSRFSLLSGTTADVGLGPDQDHPAAVGGLVLILCILYLFVSQGRGGSTKGKTPAVDFYHSCKKPLG